MSTLDRVRQDYHVAFLRFVDRGGEPALAEAYEIGRRAVTAHVPLLDFARLHHEVVMEVLRQDQDAAIDVAAAASQFLLEALAPYDMTERAFHHHDG